MPVNKSALIRYRVINRYLLTHKKATKEELRRACQDVFGKEISSRTIDADLNAMRYDEGLRYFAPIKYNTWDRTYYYEEPGYTIENIPLNNEEYETLLLAAKLLEQFSEAPVFQTFSETVKRIALQSGLRRKFGYVSLYRYLEFEGHRDRKAAGLLPDVIKAIADAKVVQIDYQSHFADKPSEYVIHPCLLKQYRSNWYLLGYSREEDKIKTFAVDRFLSFKTRDDIEFIDKRFNSRFYFQDSFGITVSMKEPVEVHLAFTDIQAKYVLSQPFHNSQELVSDNGSEVIIKYYLRPDYEFISQILAWGNQVKVLKPEGLVKMVRDHLESALEKYSG
jgi:predicted DNA-binding transcriptional regulator YafY